jgi:hypothetical protein
VFIQSIDDLQPILVKPLPSVANVKSSVANDKTVFKDLTVKHLLECSTENRQPVGKCEMKFKE